MSDERINARASWEAREPSEEILAERVAETLRRRVIQGTLRPGARIVERKLCEELRVSRTPMREALKILRHDGFVEISKNRGARVSSYTSGQARDLFEVIAGMESLAAERFAERLDDASLARLEGLHAGMLEHARAGRLDGYFDANSAIHDAIVEGCGNAVLIESHGRLILRGRRGRYMAIMDEDRWRQAIEEHEALMSALRVRDPEAAREIWREHLLHTGEAVAAALARAEEFG